MANVLKMAETAAITPVQKLTDGAIIRDPCILVADRNGKELEKAFSRFGTNLGDQRGNWKPSPGVFVSALPHY
jgi:hypothetical protein